MYKFCLPILSVLALAACDSDQGVRITRSAEIDTDTGASASKALKVVSALQCPSDQGVLTRVGSASVDGQTCTYAGPRGAEIQLHLVTLNGETSSQALKRFQNELVPSTGGTSATVSSLTEEDGTETATVTAPGVDIAAKGDDASVKIPGLNIESKGDRATVRMPGMSIEADGDRAQIRIGGMVIKADDKGSTITAPDGSLKIDANETGAVVQTQSRQAVRATMIHAISKPAPNAWRVVGYEARGPSGGPIVVATFRTRDRDEQAILESVRELVVLNVGD
ncbi:methyltransferase type 11 [Brevundimonas sp.]|uniref:methyltransferase type 11 n=1 Tax=Brevundimonas sp. TaxID=1871086 RepID=UPI00289E9880|nr:methyltransferase type 11 [Brevundimonas sp.]